MYYILADTKDSLKRRLDEIVPFQKETHAAVRKITKEVKELLLKKKEEEVAQIHVSNKIRVMWFLKMVFPPHFQNKRPKETVQEFADKVYELCVRALPEEVSNEYVNAMAVHHFSGGVLDQKISKHLFVSPPKSLHEECRKHQLVEDISSQAHRWVGQLSSGSESYEGPPLLSRSSTEESHHYRRRERKFRQAAC